MYVISIEIVGQAETPTGLSSMTKPYTVLIEEGLS